MEISCLSFNIWDLPVWLPKIDIKKRLARMPRPICALAPDLICLQESFNLANRRKLFFALPEGYCRGGSERSRWMLPFLRADCTGGLAVISRFAFEGYRFIEHDLRARMRFDERLGRKGFIISQIQTRAGAVGVVNVHLYAGRSPRETDIRLRQLEHLFSELRQCFAAETPVILAGDFNASPTTHFPLNTKYEPTPEYRRILAEGFIDTLPHFGTEHITYTGRQNVYAKLLIDASEIPKKLDYIFHRPGAGRKTETVEARVVFNGGEFLSDHNGVFCRLKIQEG